MSPDAAVQLRAAFEPRYGRALDDGEVDGIADRFRRFAELLVSWETEDRARAAPAPAAPVPDAPAPPPRRPRRSR